MLPRATTHAAALVLVAAAAGCSTPDVPGAGYGSDYTPVIDQAGVDPARYRADLDACRQMARTIDANRAATDGAIGGAIIGAVLSGMLGGGRQASIDSANVAGFSGLSHATAGAMAQSKAIVINCMVGRGYRALEVTPALGAYQRTMLRDASGPAAVAASPGPAPATPITAPAPAPNQAAQRDIGQFAYTAERIPEAKACAELPAAKLIGKGPGFELFSIACKGGDALTVRCEFGNCRALR